MELIKEIRDWKLYRNTEKRCLVIESPEGFQQSYTTAESYVLLKFDEAVTRGWIWVNKEYFLGEIIDSKIEVKKYKKQIRSDKNDLFLETHFTSKESVIEKYDSIVEKANEKFEKCRESLIKLTKELDFDIDYMMLGDTYGIYEDYQYISFTIEGIHCRFKIEI